MIYIRTISLHWSNINTIWIISSSNSKYISLTKWASFKVGGHWPLWRGWKNRMITQDRQKSNTKKHKKKLSGQHNYKNNRWRVSMATLALWSSLMLGYIIWHKSILCFKDIIQTTMAKQGTKSPVWLQLESDNILIYRKNISAFLSDAMSESHP